MFRSLITYCIVIVLALFNFEWLYVGCGLAVLILLDIGRYRQIKDLRETIQCKVNQVIRLENTVNDLRYGSIQSVCTGCPPDEVFDKIVNDELKGL